MGNEESYETAFHLNKILKPKISEFISEKTTTSYASGWSENFFEITIRDKIKHQKCIPTDIEKIKEIFKNNIPSGWVLTKINLQRENDIEGTPVRIQFKKMGEYQ